MSSKKHSIWQNTCQNCLLPIVIKIVSFKQTALQGQASYMDHSNLQSFVNELLFFFFLEKNTPAKIKCCETHFDSFSKTPDSFSNPFTCML